VFRAMLFVPRSNVRGNLHTGSESGFLHAPNPCSTYVLRPNRQSVRNVVIAVGARVQVEDSVLQIIKIRPRSF